MDQFTKEVGEAELHHNDMKEEDMRQKVFTKGRRVVSAYVTCAFINASRQFPLPICWSPVKGGIYVISETVHTNIFYCVGTEDNCSVSSFSQLYHFTVCVGMLLSNLCN
jgi:hypothetical protein